MEAVVLPISKSAAMQKSSMISELAVIYVHADYFSVSHRTRLH
jgi:hypothetical protein